MAEEDAAFNLIETLIEDTLLYISENRYPDDCTPNRKRQIRRKAKSFSLKDNELFYAPGKDKPIVKYIKDRHDQLRIAKSCHVDPTSGHLGVRKTIGRVKERFMWKGVWEDVKTVVSTCDACQRVNKNPLVTSTNLNPVPVHSPWFHVGMDFVGPIHPTSSAGNRYILTVSDYFTKWVEAVPLPSKCAAGVSKALFKIFMRMGLPKVLTSDQGGEFKSDLEKEIMKLLKIKRHYITAYHPQANGLDERWNQTLKHMLVKFTHDRKEEWDVFLDTCVFAYNTAKHESTLFSPFECMFGRKAVLPIDITEESKDGQQLLTKYHESSPSDNLSSLAVSRQECLQAVKSNVKVAQERQKRQYDQKHSLSPKFSSGIKVLKKDFRRSKRKGGGMDHRWLGPYVIVKDLSKGFFSLRNVETGKTIQRVHGAHLKIYFTSSNEETPTSLEEVNEDCGGSDDDDCEETPTSLEEVNKDCGGSDDDDCEETPTSLEEVNKDCGGSDDDDCEETPTSLEEVNKDCGGSDDDDCEETPTSLEEMNKDCGGSHNGVDYTRIVSQLQALPKEELVKSLSQLIASVEDVYDSLCSLCTYQEYCMMSCKKRSMLQYQSHMIRCVTDVQHGGLADYILNLFTEPLNTMLFSFVMDGVLPGALQQILMDRFSVSREEAKTLLFTSNARNEQLVDDESPLKIPQSTVKFNKDLYEKVKSSFQHKTVNHKRASVIETVYHSLNEPMLKSTIDLDTCTSTDSLPPSVDPCGKPHQPSNVNKLVINGDPASPPSKRKRTYSPTKTDALKPNKLSLAALKDSKKRLRTRNKGKKCGDKVFIDLTRNCDLRKGDGTCQEVKWVDVEDVNLLESDKAIIKNGDWLTDRIIGAAQMLLKKQYQDMQGLQSTLNGDTLTFDVCKGAFLQVLNVGRSHWITIASEGSNHVKVFDSIPSRSISFRTSEQIAAICFCESTSIHIEICDVQRQAGGDDCGLFALAFAAAVCAGQNPAEISFIQHQLRDHLLTSFEKGHIGCFPARSRRRKSGQSQECSIKVFCHCRQPDDGSPMIECDRCKEWFHSDCEFVPANAWSKNKHSEWFCRCCKK